MALRCLPLAVFLLMLALLAPVASADPSVDSIEFKPKNPLVGEAVAFKAKVDDGGAGPVSLTWNFGDTTPEVPADEPSHTYTEAGPYTVTVTATDANGASSTPATTPIEVRADPGPTSSFTFAPTVPNVGQTVTFRSTSEASQGQIVAWDWDLDGVGDFDDLSGAVVDHRFGTPGTHAVRLRVRQTNGMHAFSPTTSLRVNGLPVADFTWDPASPEAGSSVQLVSTSTDFEGPLAAFSWDLDGDGKFDDGSGPQFRQPFSKAGTYDIGLRVKDSDGELSAVQKQVRVAAPSRNGSGTTSPSDRTGNTAPRRLRFMTPFPVVRIAGRVLPRGALIDVLSVRTPRGARVEVRCGGRGCPVASIATTSAARLVRFRRLERRLRAGITLKVYVRQTGRIGKYTRFFIRAGKAPARLDRCLVPRRARPVRCP